jgi:hypothetical protein
MVGVTSLMPSSIEKAILSSGWSPRKPAVFEPVRGFQRSSVESGSKAEERSRII